MSNMNIGTPRFFVDYVNYQVSRGKAIDTNFDVVSGGNLIHNFETGSESELFDMRPLNLNSWDTSSAISDHVLINIDLGVNDLKTGFISILNHNLDTANGKFRIAGSNTTEAHIQAKDMPLATVTPACTEIVNGTVGATTNIITPGADGSTIIRFSETSVRYWGIQFEGNPSFSATNLSVGCILIGEYYDMPHSADLSVKRSIIFDNDIQESIGGQKYSNMATHGRSTSATSKSPFITTTSNQQVFGGRQMYDMKFSYLASADVMPNEYHTYQPTDDSFVGDVWNKTNGSHIPFILSLDNSSEGSDAESEHIFARFNQNTLDMTQVAPNYWDVGVSIIEEF